MSWSHLTSHDRVVLPRVPGCPQASLSLWEAGPVVPSPGRREVPAQDHTALAQSLARPGMLVCNSQLPRMCPPLCPWEGEYWGGYIMGSASRAFVPALICSRDSEAAKYHWPSQTVSLWTWSPKEWGAGSLVWKYAPHNGTLPLLLRYLHFQQPPRPIKPLTLCLFSNKDSIFLQ